MLAHKGDGGRGGSESQEKGGCGSHRVGMGEELWLAFAVDGLSLSSICVQRLKVVATVVDCPTSCRRAASLQRRLKAQETADCDAAPPLLIPSRVKDSLGYPASHANQHESTSLLAPQLTWSAS